MPDAAKPKPVIALALLGSAVVLFVLAALLFAGVIPIAEDVRMLAALMVGTAGLADVMIALWFFRMGQSS